MQLVRYLLLQAFKMCEKHKLHKKKIDDILLEKVYNKVEESKFIFIQEAVWSTTSLTYTSVSVSKLYL